MSAYNERIKLETMYYHMREPKHIQFLENNENYAWFRTLNTFKGGKTITDTYHPESKDRGMTQKPKLQD